MSLSIVTFDGSSYADYLEKDISISTSLRLNIQTFFEMNKTVYVKAITKFGSLPAYLPLTVVI